MKNICGDNYRNIDIRIERQIIQKWELKEELRAVESGEYIGDVSILRAEVYRRRILEELLELKLPGTDWHVSVDAIVYNAKQRIREGKIRVQRDNKFPQNSIFTYNVGQFRKF